MVQVNNLIQLRTQKVALSGLTPFPWPHPFIASSASSEQNHDSILQGIPTNNSAYWQFDYRPPQLLNSKSRTTVQIFDGHRLLHQD
jgi:hypothetical protein